MSETDAFVPGTILWHDLTVGPAEEIRDFYQRVVGWESQPVDMGDYDDFTMIAPATGAGVAGICHARGPNADQPPQWMLYFGVEDLEASAARCVELGGTVLVGPREIDGSRFCVIRDPAGAVCGLYQPAETGR